MMTATDHPLVRDYLARLREEARRLPVDQARELETDLTEHLDTGLGSDPGEAAVRDALDRLGSPAEVVAAAGGATPAPSPAPAAKSFASPVGAIICLLAAELTAPLIPIAVVLWVVGLVLLARATVWTERDKMLGFLSLGSGFVVSLAVLGLGLVAGRSGGGGCSQVSTADGTIISSGCTENTGGGLGLAGAVILVLLAAYVALQVFTVWKLTRAASRSTAAR